jgi:hypothetical protein
MSVISAVASGLRALVIAAATAGAAFGLLAVFHPFAPPTTAIIAVPSGDADALHKRIDKARNALAKTQAALDNVNATAVVVVGPDETLRAQYKAQIADAIDRRDLARRQAAAIRDALKANRPVASLAGIRDSVVIGQLLAQQAALDAQIAEQGARDKRSHPVMRALLAQRDALAIQIAAQAASIAAALESEADLDDKQIALLQDKLGTGAKSSSAARPDTAELATKLIAQRTELDALMDAYFKAAPTATTTATPNSYVLTIPNLVDAAIAGLAALASQIGFARRRRARQQAEDLAQWQDDVEPELPLDEPAAAERELRRAS